MGSEVGSSEGVADLVKVVGMTGGAVTIADGANATLGTTTDAAASSTVAENATARTGISLWKGIKNILILLNTVFGATDDAAVSTDAAGTINAHLRGIIKLATTVRGILVYDVPTPQMPTAYRTGLTAIDALAAVGTVTCTKIAGAGLTAGAYITNVVAVNAFGRGIAKVGSATITTETTNLRINAAFAAVTGATHYDIYCTTGAALWSGRITEAQRAAGVLLSTLGAGSAVDSVDIDVIGTGIAGSLATVNTAYVIPASPIDCSAFNYVDFYITASRTGDAVAPALTVQPFLKNVRDSAWYGATPVTLTFGPMKQVVRVECRGNSGVALLITAIAGTGMSVVMEAGRS